MASGKRYETLGLKFAETWIDISYEAQERTAKLGESYLTVFQEGQKTSFDLVLAWLKQVQKLQMLSFDYSQESARTSNETLSNFMRVQDEVRHDVKDRVDHQVTEIERVTKASK